MEELKMYVKYVDGKPYQYRYGESWRAMQLHVDGGYPTPEEAKAAWEAEQERNKALCTHCGKRVNPRLNERMREATVRGVEFFYPEEFAQCPECGQEVYDAVVHNMNCARRERYYEEAKKRG